MNIGSSANTLDALRFDNRFVASLPGDPIGENYRRQVSAACYSRVAPTAVAAPRLLAYAHEVAGLLDLDDATCRSQAFVDVFAGNRLARGMDPYATCYGGHQFGNWAGQLGDGRAINLGEIVNRRGERWALQLKGAGPTPYSRGADGLAVLRSSLREYLCSEAMHHLGVPTTRALSLITSGETVVRDMFYDGHPAPEPGAVVCRVAPSFTRFGHFQIFAARGDRETLRRLVDYTIATDFSELGLRVDGDDATRIAGYITWFTEVCRRTAVLIAHWMRVGFVHGVMNTDNMSILGLTIDYGPYGWIDNYDPDWTPNTTDAQGRRYRYGQQAQIALWNLIQLAHALHVLIEDAPPLESALAEYGATYHATWRRQFAQKLGLGELRGSDDDELAGELLALVETDMTIFFRALADFRPVDATAATLGAQLVTAVADAYYRPAQCDADYRARLAQWAARYAARVREDDADPERRRARMSAANPRYVLRNYLAQVAIDAATEGDLSRLDELHQVLRQPYAEQPPHAALGAKRPDWARQRAGCSMLSCSS